MSRQLLEVGWDHKKGSKHPGHEAGGGVEGSQSIPHIPCLPSFFPKGLELRDSETVTTWLLDKQRTRKRAERGLKWEPEHQEGSGRCSVAT